MSICITGTGSYIPKIIKIIKIFVMIVTVTNYMFPGGVECVWWARTSTGKTFQFEKKYFLKTLKKVLKKL